MRSLWHPAEMRTAPLLDPRLRTGPVRPRQALLINPYYPKDPHASFGKHVLTPSLALDKHRGQHSARLGSDLLGREPAGDRRRTIHFPK